MYTCTRTHTARGITMICAVDDFCYVFVLYTALFFVHYLHNTTECRAYSFITHVINSYSTGLVKETTTRRRPRCVAPNEHARCCAAKTRGFGWLWWGHKSYCNVS